MKIRTASRNRLLIRPEKGPESRPGGGPIFRTPQVFTKGLSEVIFQSPPQYRILTRDQPQLIPRFFHGLQDLTRRQMLQRKYLQNGLIGTVALIFGTAHLVPGTDSADPS